MIRRLLAGLAVSAAMIAPALAGESGDVLRNSLYAGTIAEGRAVLAPRAAAGDQEAQFGVGVLELMGGIERFGQALYRHGFEFDPLPDGRTMGEATPPSPAEPLDYEQMRHMLSQLVGDMDAASADLEKAGAGGDYAVEINPTRIRLDFNADGKADETESLAAIMTGGMDRVRLPMMPPMVPPRGKDGADAFAGWIFGFDRADALWLAGYSQIVASYGDFLLAHDFSTTFDVWFHRFFPRAGLPMQGYEATGRLVMDAGADTMIADLVAAVHSANWPVVEPDRLKRVPVRLKAVTALSRRDWDAIMLETDDDHEFLPSPRQTPFNQDMAISQDQVTAWLETLDTVDQILDGKLLVPHWRFKLGFDLRAYFDSAKHSDFIMLLTGHDALSFLREGPKASTDSFRAANQAFGNNLMGYVFWLN